MQQIQQTTFVLPRVQTLSVCAPDLSGKRHQIQSFTERRNFLLSLSGIHEGYFQELLFLEEGRILSRYFCLAEGDVFLSQGQVAELFGYSRKNPNFLCDKIHACLSCLGYPISLSERGAEIKERLIAALNEKLEKKSANQQETLRVRNLLQGTGLRSIPRNLRSAKILEFEEICQFAKFGGLAALKISSKELYEVIYLRYGFKDGEFYTVTQLGVLLGISKQAVDLRIGAALRFLRKGRPI